MFKRPLSILMLVLGSQAAGDVPVDRLNAFSIIKINGSGYTHPDYVRSESCQMTANRVTIKKSFGVDAQISRVIPVALKVNFMAIFERAREESLSRTGRTPCDIPTTRIEVRLGEESLVLLDTGACGSPYSKREGTPAARIPQQINGAVIKDRAARLRTAGQAQVLKHLSAQIGRTHQILMENPHMGRTEQFTEVAFDAPQAEGQIVTAAIRGATNSQLTA